MRTAAREISEPCHGFLLLESRDDKTSEAPETFEAAGDTEVSPRQQTSETS
jgi:hypothetical protein